MTAMTPFEVTGDLPRASLALEASAGTGKTWTLTSLAVRYIAEDGVPLPELLLVTFTRAATAELRERIRGRIAETLDAVEAALAGTWAPGDDPLLRHVVGGAVDAGAEELARRRDRLRGAAQQLDEATISTIHGFCQRMLQHAALEAGVDFDAVLLDDDVELLAEIVDDHIARELRSASPAWVEYLQRCGNAKRKDLLALAKAVAGLPALRLLPTDGDTTGPLSQPWDDAVAAFAAAWAGGGREDAVDLVARLQEDGAFAARQSTFTANRAVKEAAKVDRWLDDPPAVPPGPVDRDKLQNLPDYPMAYFTEAALRTKLADGAGVPANAVLAAAARLLDAALAPATAFQHRAATYIWHELDRRKRQRTVLTFDDLLRRLAAALGDGDTREAVRAAIRQRYRVALIDEFQDTDPVQWRIFSALFARDEPFILIGDPKQAIYAFRGADIHTYVQARDTRPDRQTLQTNRRSDRSYVAACNHLFGRGGAFASEAIPYHRIDPHHPDRLSDPTGGAALGLRFVPRSAGQVHAGLLKKGWADRALPHDVAAVAVALLEAGMTLPRPETGPGSGEGAGPGAGEEADRPLRPRDIAVLVQTNRRAHAVQRALQDAGVPAVIQRGGSVFASPEAEALQRLLAALLRPSAERAAVTAAASVLFGRDAPTLVAQRDALDRAVGRKAPLDDPTPGGGDAGGGEAGSGEAGAGDSGGGEAGHDAPTEGDAGAWDRWVDALTRWGERWHQRGLLPAVREAFAEDQVPERLLRTHEGERRLTNVRHLVELLHVAETTEGLTPHGLVDWLQAHRADAAEGDLPSAETELRLEEDAEAVRVVTIHGSKGLQYPIVLCPDLWDGAVRVDEQRTRIHDPDVPDPVEAIALDLDADVKGPRKARSLELARTQTRLEQLRLAYVALTRAQHRSIVWWGAFKDAPTSPLASLLHSPAGAVGDRLAEAEATVEDAQDHELVADLEALVEAAGGSMALEVVEALGRDAAWTAAARRPVSLEARPFSRGAVDRAWQRTSFTTLVRGASTHAQGDDPADGRDVDADVEAVAARHPGRPPGSAAADEAGGDRAAEASPDVPLAGFPRGAGPGIFLHDVLEHADLADLDDQAVLLGLLETMERRHGIDPQHRTAVVEGLRAAAATPLAPIAPGARLADLSRDRRLNELRFELPLAGGHDATGGTVTLRSIAEVLEGSEDQLIAGYAPALRHPAVGNRVRGYLNGSIDLLARLPDGRFLVADYKGNWLGDRATGRSRALDYRPAALEASMREHHYVLQALLYLVAAHRYLRWRVPDYDYDTHVAGAGYLFLRGMVGKQTPEADGGRCGIAAVRPDGALVDGLSRLLDRGAA